MKTSVMISFGLSTFSVQHVLARTDGSTGRTATVRSPARPGDRRRRVQRQQRGGRIRRMDDVAQLAADDRVVAIVTGDGVAEVAALLVAVEVLAAEEPAPRPLVDVAAQRAEVADQRRGDAQRGLRQQREAASAGPCYSMTSVSVVVAPMCAPSAADVDPIAAPGWSSGRRSGIGDGHALARTQSFITPPTRSLPPPSDFGRGAELVQHDRAASLTVVGSYSSKLFIVVSPAQAAS